MTSTSLDRVTEEDAGLFLMATPDLREPENEEHELPSSI